MATPARVAANQLRRAFSQASTKRSCAMPRSTSSVGFVACPALKLFDSVAPQSHCTFHSTAGQRPTRQPSTQRRNYSSRPPEAEHHHQGMEALSLSLLGSSRCCCCFFFLSPPPLPLESQANQPFFFFFCFGNLVHSSPPACKQKILLLSMQSDKKSL